MAYSVDCRDPEEVADIFAQAETMRVMYDQKAEALEEARARALFSGEVELAC